MSGPARAAPLLASFMMFFYLLYDVSAWLRQAPVTGRTGRRSQFGGMPTVEELFASRKQTTLTVKVSHESRVLRQRVASEAALCESENGRSRGLKSRPFSLSRLLPVVDRKSVTCSRLVYCPL